MNRAWFSLRWKVAAIVSLLLISVAILIGMALVSHQRLFLLEEGDKRVRSMAQALAVSARGALLQRNELHLGTIIHSIMQDPDAVHAYVLDHEGIVVYHPDTQLLGTRLAEDVDGTADGLIEAEVPVVVEGTQVGTAVVGLSSAFVEEATQVTAKGLLGRLALGMLFGLGGILLLTEFHVRRIARLEQAVHKLGSGDLRVTANVGGRDEFARLADDFNLMVEELRHAREEVERGVTETVSALASTIEVNDAYTRGHCERVAQSTKAIAERLGVPEADLRDFELAALLHDIGKIGVPSQVLSKEGKLDEAEFRQMQEHAALGGRILAAVSFLKDVAVYVRHHHEDWDGGGYPDGLAGEQVPLASRVIHIADAYDAMTSSRPYRKALPRAEAIRRIVADRGGQFDPAIADIFLQLEAEGALESIRRRVDEGLAA